MSEETAEMLREASVGRSPEDRIFPELPHQAVLEAIAWLDARKLQADFTHLAMSAVRVSGVVNSFPKSTRDLRRTAEKLGHTPPEFVGARARVLTRRFLPIYGEASVDEARRVARSMSGFGAWAFGRKGYAWFLNRRMWREDLWRLFWFLDSHRDAYDMSLGEVYGVLEDMAPHRVEPLLRATDQIADEEASVWLDRHREYMGAVSSFVAGLATEWERLVVAAECPPHVCGLTPIDPPEVGGVYFLRSRAPTDVAIKIGFASKSITQRIRDLQTAHPWPLELLAFIEGAGRTEEKDLHRRFDEHRLDDAPGTEWFRAEGELMEMIASLRDSSTERA